MEEEIELKGRIENLRGYLAIIKGRKHPGHMEGDKAWYINEFEGRILKYTRRQEELNEQRRRRYKIHN